ncbi:MAG: dihydrolipoamide acetyltransferase family protein [Pseudomonadota bacterium]|nr:dihydrolipoamide acetyltransferase family protein [Pseudomonadota bacterium]
MNVIMPQLGETVSEGTVSAWHRKIGDRVSTKDPLFDVSSDKVEMEVPAPAEGTLLDIVVEAGTTVGVGEVVAIIGGEDEAPHTAAPAPPDTSNTNAELSAEVRVTRAGIANNGVKGNRLSPVVQRLIAENKLDPELITGSGASGRIKKKDVLDYMNTGVSKELKQALSDHPGDTDTIPFSSLRKKTADHMLRSKAASPHVLQAVEVDFGLVANAREKVSVQWKRQEGFSLTWLPFVVRAVCVAIRDFPRVNSKIEGESLAVHRRINIGIAVDLDFDGLVAPVVKDADRMTIPELARAIRDLSERARANKLKPDDFTEGTYTISNSGVFGTLITAPIINQPQVAIMSVDGIAKKTVVVEGEDGDSIVIRPLGVLAQSFDHRAIDGAYSAAFLHRTREVIQTTNWASIIP